MQLAGHQCVDVGATPPVLVEGCQDLDVSVCDVWTIYSVFLLLVPPMMIAV